jgi:ubiquinone/menaquinone biosynthesis C-methylase UbiE
VPAYNDLLTAYHAAFAPELEQAIRELPLPAGAHVLDVPCGDGYYSVRLASRVGPGGRVTCADISSAYLTRAERVLAGSAKAVRADIYDLPFVDRFFDAVWCAQSFISLDDPVRALREMRRVVRPGGMVAVLENDEFHHVILPWPVELELVIQRAIQQASRRRYGRRSRLYPSRYLRRMMLDVGLKPRRKKTYAADRQPPFDPATRRFLENYLRSLRDMVGDDLTPEQLPMFDRYADPHSPQCVWRRTDSEVTCLMAVFVGER